MLNIIVNCEQEKLVNAGKPSTSCNYPIRSGNTTELTSFTQGAYLVLSLVLLGF